jgi:chaperonin GroES
MEHYTQFRPIGDKVLVQVNKMEVTDNGIHIPEAAQDKPQTGRVVAKGNKVDDVQQNDSIYFNKFAGVPYQDNFLILNQADIIGVL